MEKIYALSKKKRVVIFNEKVVVQIFRAGYTWSTELILTKEEFENLKKLLTE